MEPQAHPRHFVIEDGPGRPYHGARRQGPAAAGGAFRAFGPLLRLEEGVQRVDVLGIHGSRRRLLLNQH